MYRVVKPSYSAKTEEPYLVPAGLPPPERKDYRKPVPCKLLQFNDKHGDVFLAGCSQDFIVQIVLSMLHCTAERAASPRKLRNEDNLRISHKHRANVF